MELVHAETVNQMEVSSNHSLKLPLHRANRLVSKQVAFIIFTKMVYLSIHTHIISVHMWSVDSHPRILVYFPTGPVL